MSITFYFKETPKGFTAVCDLMEMSIYKGIKARGKTKESAIRNLTKKWNNKVEINNKELIMNMPYNLKIERHSFKINLTEN